MKSTLSVEKRTVTGWHLETQEAKQKTYGWRVFSLIERWPCQRSTDQHSKQIPTKPLDNLMIHSDDQKWKSKFASDVSCQLAERSAPHSTHCVCNSFSAVNMVRSPYQSEFLLLLFSKLYMCCAVFIRTVLLCYLQMLWPLWAFSWTLFYSGKNAIIPGDDGGKEEWSHHLTGLFPDKMFSSRAPS